MAKTICVFNQKGGVGKTTSVVNIAVGLSRLSKKVLVVDMDPQANTTTGFGIDKNKDNLSIYDLFFEQENIIDAIKEYKSEDEDIKVDVIASNSNLSGLEVELIEFEDRALKLRQILSEIEKDYDFLLIDCPPSLGLLSINALSASDSVLIPIQCEYYALEGVSELLNTYNMVKETLNPDLDIEGVLLCMFDSRNNLSIEVVEEVKAYFKSKVFATMIPRNIKLAEAPSFGRSVIDYEIKSKGARAYLRLSEEIAENNKEVLHETNNKVSEEEIDKEDKISKDVKEDNDTENNVSRETSSEDSKANEDEQINSSKDKLESEQKIDGEKENSKEHLSDKKDPQGNVSHETKEESVKEAHKDIDVSHETMSAQREKSDLSKENKIQSDSNDLEYLEVEQEIGNVSHETFEADDENNAPNEIEVDNDHIENSAEELKKN